MVESDPVLRLHLAIDSGRGPLPRHPKWPASRGSISLGVVAAGRLRQRPTPRWYAALARPPALSDAEVLVEYFARPLVRTFRRLVEGHGMCLLAGRGHGLAFEVASGMQPTGRIVVTDLAALRPFSARDTEDARAMVTVAAVMLHRVLQGIALGFTRPRVKDAMWQTVAQELRYLSPSAVELLGGDHPLRRLVHSVTLEQDRSLKRVIHGVQVQANARRRNRAAAPPAVIIDLDSCALNPVGHVRHALSVAARRGPGASNGIAALRRPTDLEGLPTGTEAGWKAFLSSNDLVRQYPGIDWAAAWRRFADAFVEPWEALGLDQPTSGLVEFVRAIEDAGGEVVFSTGRPERARPYTQALLELYGLGHTRLLMTQDRGGSQIERYNAEGLRVLAGWSVVAILHDAIEDRRRLADAWPEAQLVGVEVPGLRSSAVTPRPVGGAPPVVATLEMVPTPARGAVPALSHAHSIAELRIPALSPGWLADEHAVHFGVDESLRLLERLVAAADASAVRTGSAARRRTRGVGGTIHTVAAGLHHVFTRKQFWRGSRAMYPADCAEHDMLPAIANGEPVPVVLVGFPIKQGHSDLKAYGHLPDLAELGFLVRLRELHRAAQQVYPPGLAITVLTDGNHFRPRSAQQVGNYLSKLGEYLQLVDMSEIIHCSDIDAAAIRQVGPDLLERREGLIRHYCRSLHDAFIELDITEDPLRTLAAADACGSVAVDTPTRVNVPVEKLMPSFSTLFRSILHSVPVPPPPPEMSARAWSQAVYADPFTLAGLQIEALAEGRIRLLKRTWTDTIRYLAAVRADRDLGYDELFPDGVRLSVSLPTRGRCGFSPLGGSALLPWHGTAAVAVTGELTTDFALCLRDQGFVPVYSPLLGERQPWFMAPVTAVRTGWRHGAQLDPEFVRTVRLRRR